jgi:mRNA interferase RelE/StbE
LTYRIQVLKKAVKSLRSLPREDRDKISKKIDMLAEVPIPPGAKKLKGSRLDYYRIRHGNWRVIYTVNENEVLIVVVDVGHRREIYR